MKRIWIVEIQYKGKDWIPQKMFLCRKYARDCAIFNRKIHKEMGLRVELPKFRVRQYIER